MSFLAGADAAGIVLGARVPIVLTSRADALLTRLASCAVASLMTAARLTDAAGAAALVGQRGAEVLTRRLDGALLALFADKWRLNAIARDNPKTKLEPLLAGTVTE